MTPRRSIPFSPQKRRRIDAALALKGQSLRSWALANGHGTKLKTIYAILNGRRSGAKSRDLVDALKGIRA